MTPGHPAEPFWYALTDQHRAELREMGTRNDYRPETVVIREGERTDFAFVVMDGCVKVSATGRHGYQTILGLRDAGELVGELAGLDGGRRSATVSALSPVEGLLLPADRFGPFLRRNPGAAAILHRTVSMRLREADRYRSAAGSEAVPQRFAALLLHLAKRYGLQVDGGGVLIDLPLSQEDLAGLILTSKRTLGRILESWRADDIIVTGRRTMLLHSVDALRTIARNNA